MGVVHAKELNGAIKSDGHKKKPFHSPKSSEPPQPKAIQIDGIKARVDKINIDGLGRTKDDIIKDAVQDLFKAKDFPEVIVQATRVRQRLDSLGCFRNIGVYIDTSTGPKATPDGLEVTFYVKELRRIVGGVSTSVGNDSEGNLVVGLRAPNVFGRGERFQGEYSYGSRHTNNINLAFIKPLRGRWNSLFTTSVFQTGTQWPWSGYKQLDRGVSVDLQFYSSPLVKHNLQWEGVIRDLSVFSRQTSFPVREQSGPTLKSSIKHILSIDQRDQKIFPTHGSLFQLTSEFAGVGGNVGFVKNDIYLQTNYSLFEDVVLQTTVHGGFLTGLAEKKISMCDQFYLGGPLSLRGFGTRGVGPHVDGNALGSNVFWSGALHLYSPLPFRPGKGSFGDLFRTHFFINAGNIGNFNFSSDMVHNLKLLTETPRVACGLGVALKLGEFARMELNYCIPTLYRKGDQANPGFQFGIGFSFL